MSLDSSSYELFTDALELPAAERDTFLRRKCGEDAALLEDARSLLRAHESEDAILPNHVPAQPTRIGRYVIEGELGRGGMGVVYKARDGDLGRYVALKLLPRSLAQHTGWLEQFRAEARHLASLNHRNIATLHTIEESDGIHFLTMEYIDGVTLADRLRDGPLDADEFRRFGSQIADALAFAHEQSIIHRDIKPSNVKVRSDGTVKVLDFGLSTSMKGAVETSGVARAGTPGYQSPEQFRGESTTSASDMFSLGVLFFESLTASRMVPASSRTQFGASLEAGVHTSAERLAKELPVEWRERVANLVAQDPGRRPSAREVADWFGPQARNRYASRSWMIAATTLLAALIGMAWLYRSTVSRAPEDRSASNAASAVHTRLTHSGQDQKPRISPDGSWVAFNRLVSAQRSEVRLQEVGTTTSTSIFDASGLIEIQWCPNGEELLVTAARGAMEDRSTYWIRRDGTLVHDFGRPMLMSFSPDGSEIAYSIIRDDEIRFLDARSFQPIPNRIIQSHAPVIEINWAPDPEWVMYSTGGTRHLYRLTSGEQLDVPAGQRIDSSEWSSNGVVLFHARMRDELFGRRIEGGQWSEPWTVLEDFNARDLSVAYESDRIVYRRGPSRSNVWTMNLESGESRRLTLNTLDETRSRLRPDGSGVIFCRRTDSDIRVLSVSTETTEGEEIQLGEFGEGLAQLEWAGGTNGWFAVTRVGMQTKLEWIDGNGHVAARHHGPTSWLRLHDVVGTTCYLQTDDGAGLYAWDAETGETEGVIPPDPDRKQWVARVSPASRRVAVLESRPDGNDSRIAVYEDGAARWIHGPVAAPIGWSEDGASLYLIREAATASGESSAPRTEIVKIDVRTLEEESLGFLPPSMHRWSSVDISEDGRTVVFVVSDLYGDVWLVEGLRFEPGSP